MAPTIAIFMISDLQYNTVLQNLNNLQHVVSQQQPSSVWSATSQLSSLTQSQMQQVDIE